jgi:ABC-type multidrug transport system fused ATPase/permease subunit
MQSMIRIHQYSIIVAYILSTLLVTIGILSIFFTSTLEHHFFTPDSNQNEIGVIMKFCGVSQLSFGFNCIYHLIKIDKERNREENVRMVLSSMAFFGLLTLLVIISSHVSSSPMFKVCSGIGFMYIVVACIGIMATCYPMDHFESERLQSASSSSTTSRNQTVDPEQPENTVPLLSNHDNIDENSAVDDTYIEEEQVNRQDHESDIHGRITGTKRLIKLAGPQSYYLYMGCIVLLIRLPFSMSIPHFVSETIGALAKSDYDDAMYNIYLLLGLGTVDAVLDFFCVFLFGLTNLKITKGVRIDTFAAILQQEIAFFDVNKSGDLASRLNSDCGEMAFDLTWFFRFSIESVVRITGYVTYMLVRSSKLGLCTISVVPICAIVNMKYSHWLSNNALKVQNALAQANSVAQEAFSCVRTVIAFASEDLENAKYREKIEHHYLLNVKQIFAQGFYYMIVSTFLINTVVQALLLYVGMNLIQTDQLSTEVLLAFMLYQSKLQNEVQNLFNSLTSLIKSSGAGDKVFELLDRKIPEPGTGNRAIIRSSSSDTSMDETQTDTEDLVDIRLTDVHFSYPSRPEQKVLNGLSLHVKAGKTLALVGSSGCGKSTVVGLLQRFYDPDSGQICVNNKDLRRIDLKKYRKRIGVVTQDPVLFTGSIFDNITYGRTDVNQEDVITAAKLANAHNFVCAFPDGYDTQVGERGASLSGGQKQRIAIARAILSKPSLLLLDEATSALDSTSEQLVQEALDTLLDKNQQMTTVIIAHRLQTVRNADTIVVLEKGMVSEFGTHDELLKKNGIYRRMVTRAESDGGTFAG